MKLKARISISSAAFVAALMPAASRAEEPKLSLDPCIESAATFHGVNAKTLKAIIFQESGGKSGIKTENSNQTSDYGAAGINSVHLAELAKFGITKEHLQHNGCLNVYVGAWKYSKKIHKHGNSWIAVGAYHSETPANRDRYIQRIQRHLVQWGLLEINMATHYHLRQEIVASAPKPKEPATPPKWRQTITAQN